jgi:hypothetical protein
MHINRLISIVVAISFTSHAVSQEVKPPRWDDMYFGFTPVKSDKGRFWVVSETVSFSGADILMKGDEILDVDRKRVTVDDDLIGILKTSGDEVEIRVKRMVGSKRFIDRATFKRSSLWEITKTPFKVTTDPVNEWDLYEIKGMDETFSNKTHLIPEIIFKDDTPLSMLLRFQYRAEDWLFIRKLTIKVGDASIEVERDLFSGTKREVLNGGIKEWFTLTGDEALRINKAIRGNLTEDCLIRLHGKDYYKDISLTKLERGAMEYAGALWEYGKQRQLDLANGN